MTGWLDAAATGDDLILVGPVLPALLDAAALRALGLGAAPQVAVDGGIHYALSPILWAGDGDSGYMPKDISAHFKESQDITDIRFCLDGLRTGGWRRLHLFGFLGERRDHELANLGEIHREMLARANFDEAVIYSADYFPSLRFLQKGSRQFAHQGEFSLLAFEAAEVSLSGDCLFKGENIQLPPLSGNGISNVASGMVTVQSTQPLLLVAGR